MDDGAQASRKDRLLATGRLVWRAWLRSDSRHVGLIAAGIAFFSLLAILPAVAAMVAVVGLWADPALIEGELETLRDWIPPQAFGLLEREVDRLVGDHQQFGSWTAALSLAVSLWSARLGVGALIQGLNAVYGVPNRGGIAGNALALGMTLVLIAVALIALATVVLLPIVLAFFPLGWLAEVFLRLANWAILLAVVTAALALLYRFGPNRRRGGGWLTPGVGVALVLWAAVSLAFTWFVGRFGGFGPVYGSLAAVIALQFWFYLSAYVVLFGAAIDAEAERGARASAAQAARAHRLATASAAASADVAQ